MWTILAAQNAGNNGSAIYSAAAPGLAAAYFIVGCLVLFAVVCGIVGHFTDKSDPDY
jgi:hypothetical protein